MERPPPSTGAFSAQSDERENASSNHRRVFGTLQLLLGLLLIILSTQIGFRGEDLVFVTGLLLAGSCILWFGVLERRSPQRWQ